MGIRGGWGFQGGHDDILDLVDDVGPVEIDVPRDRGGAFVPQIVKKRQRRLTGVDGWSCHSRRRI